MNKRVIVLVLLLLSVFFYSCSSKKNSTEIKSKKVVIPEQFRDDPTELTKDKQKKEKEKDVDLKQQHYNRQTKEVQKAMKQNMKISMKNTPVRAKKRSCSSSRRRSCPNGC